MKECRKHDLKLVPGVKHLRFAGGTLVSGGSMELTVSRDAESLGQIIASEYAETRGHALTWKTGGEPYTFALRCGAARKRTCPRVSDASAYALECGKTGLFARAVDYAGLVHAWQTTKQVLRGCGERIPCFRIQDKPDLLWRVYHIDLKGTRRTLDGLYQMLPMLAEFKVNAVLVEYEDYIVLERHPDIAIPEAIDKGRWRDWIKEAAKYGISVIPLVQTLGHWQYILNKPRYAHLAEDASYPSEGCSSNPETWELVKDFLDEILELHPDAPFIHVGLDETAHVGTCERCRSRIGKGSRYDLYVEWLNRVVSYVVERGSLPMVWGDIAIAKLNTEQVGRVSRDAVFVDWGYSETGPLYPLLRYKGHYVSREWLKRPNGEIADIPAIPFGPGTRFLEDMDKGDMARLQPHIGNAEFPKQIKRSYGTAILRQMGFRTAGVSGIRTSSHGHIMPKFITGQLNTMSCANMARESGGLGVIGSSWARGHSLTTQNAHPDLDWYGVATLGDCGWNALPLTRLRDFDSRFAFQFFGHGDGTIGDLHYLCDRTQSHVDHTTANYLDYVSLELERLKGSTTRNVECLDLLLQMVELRKLLFRGEFALLEVEYFYPIWARVPPDFAERILKDLADVAAEMTKQIPALAVSYAKALICSDAEELAQTQLAYLRDALLDARQRIVTRNRT